MALDKGLPLLDDLTTEYSYANEPMANLNTANEEAVKLIIEYNRIITFMNMICDYVLETSKILEQAKQLDDENRKKAASQKVGVVA